MGTNSSSWGFLSRLGTGDNGSNSLTAEKQNTLAPKFAKAASYVSSTLAVTSTFASEKLSTASTKIADLWQHNQSILPQQQQQQQQQRPEQEQQQGSTTLYHQDSYYHSSAGPTSGEGAHYHQPSVGHNTHSYDGQAQLLNANNSCSDGSNNYHYQSSCYNNPYNNIGSEQETTTICGTRNPLATSTLTNAASVAGSYLPSLSKLPALPTLLPWANKDKHQLPQQHPPQTLSQYPQDRHYSQEHAYHSQQQDSPSYTADEYDTHHHNSHSSAGTIWTSTGAWLGGLRNEMQKGRRIVETGVQAGVAWWLDSDVKNPLGNVV
ncbi:hypothetical protein B0O80DRAFT_461639 [Mortierella sp. GBAus27b]|nr:hypothetical protein B0O80DRAFT_461639 [Mortierella sp. GBAus27b]